MLSIYGIISWVLLTAGVWRILNKCGMKGWPACIPGLRYYKLSACCGKETDGLISMILELGTMVLSAVSSLRSDSDTLAAALVLIVLVLNIVLLVYRIRISSGLLRTFRMSRKWIILWVVVPWFAAMIMGFGKSFRADDLAREEESLAGGRPADLSAAVDDDDSGNGLVVHVRARTVKQLSGVRYLLKDINLTIPNGSLVLLLGGSGSGKTTLINAINGYEKADAEVKLNGMDLYTRYEELKYRIGFVPQQELLRMNDSVQHTLEDAARLRLPADVTPEERGQIVEHVMEVLGLSGNRDGLVGKKSGGMKKRISIGMELINDPDLFILDEPDSGLDGVIARELFEKLRAVADEGKIVLVITHTPDRVVDFFDKVIVLARDSGKVGRLAFYGTPDEAREFFGKGSMEEIVMAVSRKDGGGEGRADEFIEKYANLTAVKAEKESVVPAEGNGAEKESDDLTEGKTAEKEAGHEE